MNAEYYTDTEAYPADRTIFITIASDNWSYPSVNEDNSLKARRRRFQEFTRSLHREARFTGIRPAGRRVQRKKGARAREQRTRKLR